MILKKTTLNLLIQLIVVSLLISSCTDNNGLKRSQAPKNTNLAQQPIIPPSQTPLVDTNKNEASPVENPANLDPELKPKSAEEKAFSQLINVPESTYLVMVTARASGIKLLGSKVKFSENAVNMTSSERLSQLQVANEPNENVDGKLPVVVNQSTYMFFMPGDQIEFQHKVTTSTPPDQYKNPFDFSFPGQDSCLNNQMFKNLITRPSDGLQVSIFEELKSSVDKRDIYITIAACLGNLRVIDYIKRNSNKESLKSFIQDWVELTIAHTRDNKLGFDPTQKLVNQISLYRFLNSLPESQIVVPEVGDMSHLSIQQFTQKFDEIMKSINPKEINTRYGTALAMFSELIKFPMLGNQDQLIPYLKKAQEKHITYSAIRNQKHESSDETDRQKLPLEYLEDLKYQYLQTQEAAHSLLKKHFSNLNSKKDNIIVGMQDLTAKTRFKNESTQRALMTAITSIRNNLTEFNLEFNRQWAKFAESSKEPINISGLERKWKTYSTAVSKFSNEIKTASENQSSLNDKNSSAQLEEIKTIYLTNNNQPGSIKSELIDYLNEPNNLILKESLGLTNGSRKAFLNF